MDNKQPLLPRKARDGSGHLYTAPSEMESVLFKERKKGWGGGSVGDQPVEHGVKGLAAQPVVLFHLKGFLPCVFQTGIDKILK